jgi:ABC-type molybdenum transport system ATPase subunit/photorepair protein PhrA
VHDLRHRFHAYEPTAGSVIRGANPAGKHLIVSVLCGPCYQHPNSKQRVVERIRSGMIQDLREIQAGHA